MKHDISYYLFTLFCPLLQVRFLTNPSNFAVGTLCGMRLSNEKNKTRRADKRTQIDIKSYVKLFIFEQFITKNVFIVSIISGLSRERIDKDEPAYQSVFEEIN